jgi:hypothetical protein
MSITFTATQTMRLYFACEDLHCTFPGASEDALEIRVMFFAFKRRYDDYRRGNCKLAEVRKHLNKLTRALDTFSPYEVISYGGSI